MTSVNHAEPDLAKTYLRKAVRLCRHRRRHLLAISHLDVLMEDFSKEELKNLCRKTRSRADVEDDVLRKNFAAAHRLRMARDKPHLDGDGQCLDATVIVEKPARDLEVCAKEGHAFQKLDVGGVLIF